jgi:hypothetical protein
MKDIQHLFVPPASITGLLNAHPEPEHPDLQQAAQDEIMVLTVEAMKKLAFEEYAANEHVEKVCRVEDVSTIGRAPEGVVGAECKVPEAPAIIDEWELAATEAEKHFDLLHGSGTDTRGEGEDDDEDDTEEQQYRELELRDHQASLDPQPALPPRDLPADAAEVTLAAAPVGPMAAPGGVRCSRGALRWRDDDEMFEPEAVAVDGTAPDMGPSEERLADPFDDRDVPVTGSDPPGVASADRAVPVPPSPIDAWEWAAADAQTNPDPRQSGSADTEHQSDGDGDDGDDGEEQEQREIESQRSQPSDARAGHDIGGRTGRDDAARGPQEASGGSQGGASSAPRRDGVVGPSLGNPVGPPVDAAQLALGGAAVAALVAAGVRAREAAGRWRSAGGGGGTAGKAGQDKCDDKAPAPKAGKAAPFGKAGARGALAKRPPVRIPRSWSLRRAKLYKKK